MSLSVRPSAAAEIDEAYVWYEDQRAGLGEDLLDELRTVLETVGESPKRHRVIHRDTRRALLRHFPYSVFYRLLGDDVVVIGFFHASRDPRIWRQRR